MCLAHRAAVLKKHTHMLPLGGAEWAHRGERGLLGALMGAHAQCPTLEQAKAELPGQGACCIRSHEDA